MELMEAIRGRRSVRRYRPDPVESGLLEQVLEAGRWAPSWANTQCWRFVVVRDPDRRARLAECLPERNRARAAMQEAPVTIAVCAQRGLAGWYRGELVTDKGDWFMFDAALAAQNMMLAAHGLGLATVAVGYFDAGRAARVLELPAGVEAVLLLVLGWPAERPAAPPRRELAEIAFAERYGQPLRREGG